MKNCLSIILWLWFATELAAQQQQIFPIQLTDPRGAEGKANCLFQDKMGFLWVGKENGLLRYDGYETKIYLCDSTASQGVGSNSITVIEQDQGGDLWLGTKGGGLNRLMVKTGTFTRYLHNKNDSLSIISNDIKCICADGNGNYLIGTEGDGISFFNPKTQKFIGYKVGKWNSAQLKSNSVLRITPAGNGKFWVSTWAAGFYLFNPQNNQFVQIGKGTRYEKLSVYCVKEVRPGILWVGTYNSGLLAYNIKLNSFTTIVPNNEISYFKDIWVSARVEIYVASTRGLLYFKDAHSGFTLVNGEGFDANNMSRILIDRSQSVWAIAGSNVSRTNNLGKINSFRRRFYRYNPFMPNTDASSMLFNNPAQSYFISKNHLVEYNLNTQTIKAYPIPVPLVSKQVYVPDINSIVCVGTKSKILFDKKLKRFFPLLTNNKTLQNILDSEIRTINPDTTTGLWISGFTGLYHIALDTNTKNWKIIEEIPYSPGTNLSWSRFPNRLLHTAYGSLLIGTWGNGLCVREKNHQNLKFFTHNSNNPNSLSNDFIVCMVPDSKGNILIGTQAGLNRYNPKNNTFTQLTSAHGLANDWIWNIAVDHKNRIWMTTQAGISMVSDDFATIRNYGSNDGLPDKDFLGESVATDPKGNIYFGSEKGLVWFHPDSIFENPYVPQVAVVGFKINNQTVTVSNKSPLTESIEYTNTIRLTETRPSLTFQLAALSYFNPKENKIRYMLKGYDTAWITAKANQTAHYANLPRGIYTFMTMAANEDGVWNPQPKVMAIIIEKPFWLSVWAWLFYGFLVAMGAVYLLKYRKRIQQPKKQGTETVSTTQPVLPTLKPADELFLQKALNYVEENIADTNFGADALRDKMCLSQRQLYRKINSITGLTIPDFIKEIRLKKAAQLLAETNHTVLEISEMVGFNTPKYFSVCFKQQFGLSPAQYAAKMSENRQTKAKN